MKTYLNLILRASKENQSRTSSIWPQSIPQLRVIITTKVATDALYALLAVGLSAQAACPAHRGGLGLGRHRFAPFLGLRGEIKCGVCGVCALELAMGEPALFAHGWPTKIMVSTFDVAVSPFRER
jgi:hypothetical protein